MKINIISLPRTGSSYLIKCLVYHTIKSDKFFSVSEPFNRAKNFSYTFEMLEEKVQNSSFVIIKTQIFELYENNFEIETWTNMFSYIITLVRKNIFEASLSRFISTKFGHWDKRDLTQTLYVEWEEFVNFVNQTLLWSEKVIATRSDKLIFYEDLSFKSNNDILLFKLPTKYLQRLDQYYKSEPYLKKEKVILNYKEIKDITNSYIEGMAFSNFCVQEGKLIIANRT